MSMWREAGLLAGWKAMVGDLIPTIRGSGAHPGWMMEVCEEKRFPIRGAAGDVRKFGFPESPWRLRA